MSEVAKVANNNNKKAKKPAGKKFISKTPLKLHVTGWITGHRRSKRKTRHQTTLLSIDGVQTQYAARFYLGKRVAFIYKGQKAQRTRSGRLTKLRVIWGRIVKPHGKSGTVQAKFARNIPPSAYGRTVRVMLYPSNI